nr:MAG TPA: hypothetical protein [Caudoviricetes sp.]
MRMPVLTTFLFIRKFGVEYDRTKNIYNFSTSTL